MLFVSCVDESRGTAAQLPPDEHFCCDIFTQENFTVLRQSLQSGCNLFGAESRALEESRRFQDVPACYFCPNRESDIAWRNRPRREESALLTRGDILEIENQRSCDGALLGCVSHDHPIS